MRKGLNPNKDQYLEFFKFTHQVIIPVYIPNEEGYFKDSFKIFKLCLKSLFQTIHDKTFITVVNNGSGSFVYEYVNELFISKKIHEVIHTENVGKLNAILKGLVGHNISLITISDADTLFLPDWQTETFKIFNSVPKAGVVGLTPQFKMYEAYCGNIIFENLLNKKMQFIPVKSPNALINFYDSIGWERNYNQDYLKFGLGLIYENLKCYIGSGHFVATYKKDIFDELKSFIEFKLGGESEKYLDVAPLKKGYWRLTTYDNFAFHMGNKHELWMDNVVENFENHKGSTLEVKFFKLKYSISKFEFFIKNRLFVKLFSYRIFKKVFYWLNGLPKGMRSTY